MLVSMTSNLRGSVKNTTIREAQKLLSNQIYNRKDWCVRVMDNWIKEFWINLI